MCGNIDLKLIVSEANSIFENLSKLDPNLKKKAYRVLSSRFGQCNLSADVPFVLKEFPKAFVPLELVNEYQKLLSEKDKAFRDVGSSNELSEKLKKCILGLSFSQDVMVELRFYPGSLDYSLIQKITQSELISNKWRGSPLAPILFNVNDFLLSNLARPTM